MRVTWVQPEDLIRHELWQSEREGRDVAEVRKRWLDAGGQDSFPYGGASPEPAPAELVALASELLDELDAMPTPTAGDEPSDWDAIVATWSATPPRLPQNVDHDRVRGAWLGRAIGCLLGKPVEKVPRRGIEEILRATDRWPLTRYFTAVGLPAEVSERWPWNKASRSTSLEENIDGMPEDDDLNYTLMALRLVEAKGHSFTSDDVAQSWLLDLPAGRVFTAERTAYRNLLMGLSPPLSARRHNPYREWIGAQIRTDLYGWVCPGNPGLAAELAWRDAAVSHTANGLYGAMLVAAMASAAVVASSVDEVIDAGLSVVPPRSRLAAAVRRGRELGTSTLEPAEAYATLEAEYGDVHWVHTLNNTALLTYALSAGGGDFDRTICLTVMGGWDTDSSGATAGAVLGALVGAASIDDYWTAPLRDHLSTSIPGCHGSSFDGLATRTTALLEPDTRKERA
ncbi:ADP-ribosylglycohydrolase family protein [Propionibacteriaceae bacterium G1746]